MKKLFFVFVMLMGYFTIMQARQCGGCGGSGRVMVPGISTYGVSSQKVKCPRCQQEYYKGSSHLCICSSCGGTGEVGGSSHSSSKSTGFSASDYGTVTYTTPHYSPEVNGILSTLPMAGKTYYNPIDFNSYASSTPHLEEGLYCIRSVVNNNYCIDLYNNTTQNGNNINLWQNNGTNAQLWWLKYENGNAILQCYSNSGYSLDLNGAQAYSGNNIQCWQSNSTKAQRWNLEYAGNGWVIHSAIDWNYVIDLDHSNAQNGANIQCWQSNGTNAQKWLFVKMR